MLVNDRLVNERPKRFGGLQLGTIRRQINEANTIGDFEIGWDSRDLNETYKKESGLDARQREAARKAAGLT